ncbi:MULTISPECIES: hypothetical protein [unclassified Paracoccus (in: a-proteobacteria)]|uniref:hypothetical protein n=1 Tax=unclassified Paracoccus (in: a-proteobacteria) TaxID=2688777 RepID=UPI0021E11427|nr:MULTISPECIES: hypothetical protein [unclassified Paracoccus (in: a-proteobacteria)]UXU74009.1 hypothetical protein GB879_008750 [Paracoccus sp. SMMA_5]UXU79897.1 hypothetical protein GB880_008730 [Paracoccus sp. SMMA_5_TC]
MTTAEFLLAVLALLLAPGPTNTLMALAGLQGGWQRPLRLIPAELAGYLAAILPLTWLGAPLLAHFPGAAVVLKLAAAAWVGWLALRLWRISPRAGHGGRIGARRILVTTLLNPKALVLGLVILPPMGDPAFLPRLAWFCLLVAMVAALWGVAGSLGRCGRGDGLIVQRAAACWLAVVAATLLGGAIGA